MDIKNISIEEIGLSTRSKNALLRANVLTVGDMLRQTEESLIQIRNLGGKSVQEILEKIAEYKQYIEDGGVPPAFAECQGIAVVPEEWVQAEENRPEILAFIRTKGVGIDELELLSAKAYNLLQINGMEEMHQILFRSHGQLMEIPRMDSATAEEIMRLCHRFLKDESGEICAALLRGQAAEPSLEEMLRCEEYRGIIEEYVKENDWDLEKTDLPNRAKNQLRRANYCRMSEIVFLTKEVLLQLPAMGEGSANAVLEVIRKYLKSHENSLLAVCRGDFSALYDDVYIQRNILRLYSENAFAGYHLSEMGKMLSLPSKISAERVEQNIGALMEAQELECIDYRYYRIYGKFQDYFESCSRLDERQRDIIRMRLEGLTLDAIGQEFGLTRERIRQIVNKGVKIVRNHYKMQTGKTTFAEEQYRYIYETYEFDKQDIEKWVGIPAYVWTFLDLIDVKPGKSDIEEALNDHKNIGLSVRLKIKDYCNRDRLCIDGVWVRKKRNSLVRVAAKKICAESISFNDFCDQYNELLRQAGIPYDLSLYIGDDEESRHARAERLRDNRCRFILWTPNRTMRYYDIDSRDYTELLETLQLDMYKNIELSTAKFMRDYPDVMKKYDIRDQYELHNLLRKVVPDGAFNDFHCGRMPHIEFGTFNREDAIWELIANNAPISPRDLCALVEEEYGFDADFVQADCLRPFSVYYHQGMYKVDQKKMSDENQALLKASLTDDFYFIDEIKEIYTALVPGADKEEVNPYNLKRMGFIVLSKYVLQNYPSLDAYYKDILTKEDIVDITGYRNRFAYVQMFSQVLVELKKNLTVVELEPNKLIQFRKLETFGITREKIQEYCSAVYDFVDEGGFFSIRSLRGKGFDHELFEFGFSDWFYANLLQTDCRFTMARIYGTLILCKNKTDVTIQSFLVNRIQEHRMIDAYDLLSELTDYFGCRVEEKSKIPLRLVNTEVYYDRILDRYYSNVDAYYEDLAEGEF